MKIICADKLKQMFVFMVVRTIFVPRGFFSFCFCILSTFLNTEMLQHRKELSESRSLYFTCYLQKGSYIA